MTITVTPLSSTRVLVIREPALIERILYRRTASTDLAALTDVGWFYTPGGWVGRDVEAAIEKAV